MAEKLLVAIAAHGATVARWRGARLADCREFAGDAEGIGAFREYLAALPDAPAYVMVDAVEEDYRFETLPHAFGPDRAQMAARKLRQHYRNTPYMTAWLLGRDTGKRRDDRYLFSALTNPELAAEWLQAIAARGLPVAGVYLLPLVSAALPEKLKAGAANLLVVAQHSVGLRLTFFRDRQFRLSRLTRGESGRSDNRAQHYAEEISNTRLYLHALRTLTLDEPLSVLLIDRTDELGEVAQVLARENPSLECIRVGRRDIAGRLGVSEALIESSPYAMYLQLLGQGAPRSNLAPENVTVDYRRFRTRRAIYAGCAALAACGAVWAGALLYQVFSLRGETEDAARQTARLTAQYQEITRQFPAAPASADNLKKTVEIALKLRTAGRTPAVVMAMVSRALDASPGIVIRELDWKYGATLVSREGVDATKAKPAPEATPLPGAPPGAPPRRQSALIGGEIRPFRGDYRAAIASINEFAARLGADPQVAEVRIVKLPLNVNPTLSISGNTLASPDQTATADFRLVLVMKPST
ncbi:MAG: hypothetical protein IT529_17795 [Burkholderiales bacterium]|nr:hypothetical protein [Burkholderiales bacterium]